MNMLRGEEGPREQKKCKQWKKNLVGKFIYGIILPSYIGIIMNHYKDPGIKQPV